MKKFDIFNKKEGARLEDKEKHEKVHKEWNRREFIRTTGLFSFAFSTGLGGFPVLTSADNSMLKMLSSLPEDRILVLINLNGGNDGLNMVVERHNDEYYRIRPDIGVRENNMWHLSDQIGMPLNTQSLRNLWDEGQMKVIHNVGYPNPNYSHFRSSDIWASASDSDTIVNTGWIGRFLEEEYPEFLEAQPTHPPAIQIGVQADLTFRGKDFTSALALSNPEEFYRLASTGNLYPTDNIPNTLYGDELRYVRQTVNSAFRYSDSIRTAFNKGQVNAQYPNHYFARSLEIVSKLIKGGLKTKVYMVSLYGFDTHAGQLDSHPFLMETLANSVNAFYTDLGQELSGRVLSTTFSEFGRTIYENASDGTDHGTGAPMLMFGGNIGQGFVGNPPDLINLDQYGDPFFDVDFKDVYNTILTGWFGFDDRLAEFMIGQKLNKLNGMLPPYKAPEGMNAHSVLFGHRKNPTNKDEVNFQIGTPYDGSYIIELTDVSGQVVRKIAEGFLDGGVHIVSYNFKQKQVRPGKYFAVLRFAGLAHRRVIYV